MPLRTSIRVPCSSANLGPGFDVFGLALKSCSSLPGPQTLTAILRIDIEESLNDAPTPLNCIIACEGEGSESISHDVDKNLITKVSLYVLRCHGMHAFKVPTKVRICNGISLSRGLGSSAAAVVAGVMLGNEVGRLNLTRERMFDYCLMVERHPDNVAAALFGGFVGTFMRTLSPADTIRSEIPLSEVLPEISGGTDTGELPIHEPPSNIGSYHQFKFNRDIKSIVVVPNFKLDTSEARKRLPLNYSREDTVFNAQRCSLLPVLLGEDSPNAAKISEAMRDRLHQPYRADLIPGFAQVLTDVTHERYPGLLGVSLSGAGPSILAFAVSNHHAIAEAIIGILSKAQQLRYDWQVLELATEGAIVVDI